MKLPSAKSLALALMSAHGLSHWAFKFDRAVRRFGYCSYRTKTISLSENLVALNDVSIVQNTILHEIAHALVGSGHGHSAVWKAKAIEIGCSGERCYGGEVKRPAAVWRLTCPTCRRSVTRTRKPSATLACGVCCKSKYDAKHIFKVKPIKQSKA